MERSQKIYCNVESCKFNNLNDECSLSKIKVAPIQTCDTKEPNESMCSNYEHINN